MRKDFLISPGETTLRATWEGYVQQSRIGYPDKMQISKLFPQGQAYNRSVIVFNNDFRTTYLEKKSDHFSGITFL